MTTPPESRDSSLFDQLIWTNEYTPPVSNIQLSWANFARQYSPFGDFYYRLDMCAGEVMCDADSDNWKIMGKTQESNAMINWADDSNGAPIERYQFRVTACNECGCSKSCTPLTIRRVMVPHPCNCPKVTTNQCSWTDPFNKVNRGVTVQWKRPAWTGGAPVEEY